MQRRSVEARKRNRAAGGAAAGAAPGAAGGAGGDEREEARRALMRIVRGKGNDAAVVSAAKAVLDAVAPVEVDVESGLEGLTDEQLAARITALREELATA